VVPVPHVEAITSLLGLLRERRTFLITSHARPDGDAIGSSLGLMHLLDSMGKDVTVAFSDPIPHIFEHIPGIERIVHHLPATPPDAAILLECDSVARTGFAAIDAHFTINIDHHLSGRAFGDFNWIDPEACAVGAMVYDLAILSGMPITPAMATCLYTAVLTDTGGFTYSSTTASTFGLAQHLLESGADATGVSQAVYFSNAPSKLRLLGAALNHMHIDGPIAWAWVTQADMATAGAVVEDCEGVVNYLIGMSGICAAVFLRELPTGEFRISLRSKNSVDVAAVAAQFAGGGHRNASGGNVDGPIEAAVSRIVSALHAACEAPV
jgi:phosphoesterase RecJ-like protein